MTQDTHRRAVEEFEDAREAVSDQYTAMREDLRFSDPTSPQQWDKQALALRAGRPCLTFDRTNQFISQVVNSARQNKPSIHVLPATSDADEDVAEKLNGIIRHIEYVSRAGIAYDTALEHSARIGLGWLRVIPEVMRPETNEQELRIKRVHDPLSCYLSAGWTEPDGSDATVGWVETMMSKKAFKATWPKASLDSWEHGVTGWIMDEQVRICEEFRIIETPVNRFAVDMQGQSVPMDEDEYRQLCGQVGFEVPARPFIAKIRSVKWSKLSGCEVLEETDFPSSYLPLIPTIGHEIWIDGKRHLCGMTRRLKDSQRAYNYERSAFIESVAMQPKAPLMAPFESMEGHELAWGSLNTGNPSVLPYNHVDDQGNPIPQPTRLTPPAFPVAFAQGGQIASTDMESSVGMFRANLGAPGQAISGRAKREDKVAGDTANFHYIDNLSRTIEQLGRVVVDMIPRVYDTARQARIVGEDGEHGFVGIDPDQQQPAIKQGKQVVSINPGIGAYDVRVKTGPAYTTLREEQSEQLANMMQAAPQLMPILGDLWVGAQDWPGAEVARKRLAAMLPPQIQQMESDGGEEISPEVHAALQQKDAQIQQLSQAMQAAAAHQQELEQQIKSGASVEQFKAQALAQREADKHQRELQFEQYKAQIEAIKSQHEAEVEREKMASDERSKQLELQFAKYKADLDAETRVLVAQIGASKAAAETENPSEDKVEGGAEEPSVGSALAVAIDGFSEALTQIRAPRTIIRGPDGRVQAIA